MIDHMYVQFHDYNCLLYCCSQNGVIRICHGSDPDLFDAEEHYNSGNGIFGTFTLFKVFDNRIGFETSCVGFALLLV